MAENRELNWMPQTEDGFAHVAYYHKEKELSFTYNSTKGPWIDISHGGYAEPVIMRIPLMGGLYPEMPLNQFLANFRKLCYDFAEGYQHNG